MSIKQIAKNTEVIVTTSYVQRSPAANVEMARCELTIDTTTCDQDEWKTTLFHVRVSAFERGKLWDEQSFDTYTEALAFIEERLAQDG